MTCWRCGRVGRHAAWCSMSGGCLHCGWSPCRWWCEGEAAHFHLNDDMPFWGQRNAYQRERNRRINAGTWVFA